MADEGEGDEFSVADFVYDETAQDDPEAEPREACAADVAELGGGEAEFFGPVIEDSAADGKANAGGQNRHETGPQEPVGIRGDCPA